MSKIVSAVNAMISHPEKISEVSLGVTEGELFFLYDGKYKWSMKWDEKKDIYYIYYYPGDYSLSWLTTCNEWESVAYVTYRTDELKTREAMESFAELYTTLKGMQFNIEGVLDDIIDDMQL